MARIKAQEARLRAVGYARVSTPGQVVEGVSLEVQEAAMRAWATSHVRTLENIHTDAGLSGKRADNRPGLQAALEEVCQARGTLVVYSLARMARSVKDTLSIAERLETCGADLVSLSEQIDTTGASGRMIFKVLAVLAEFERDLASERTRAALLHKRALGQKTGGDCPFGWRAGALGKLEPHPGEQRVLTTMRRWHGQGVSLRAIAERLAGAGATQKRGGRWTKQAVHRTLGCDLRRRAAVG